MVFNYYEAVGVSKRREEIIQAFGACEIEVKFKDQPAHPGQQNIVLVELWRRMGDGPFLIFELRTLDTTRECFFGRARWDDDPDNEWLRLSSRIWENLGMVIFKSDVWYPGQNHRRGPIC